MQEDQQDKVVDYLKRTVVDLRHARQRIDELEGRDREPVAIVGMACRYPGGVRSPEDLWELVSTGGDAIAGFPTDRGWDLDELRAESTTREGGFLYDAAEFDASFFGISPREAQSMDPQQRLLLEVTWEAVERAGVAANSLRGERAGVFIGAYNWGRSPAPGEDDLQGHTMTGTAASVLSGRLAYTLGLEGPALTVDTACSSSLVALHVASRSLRAGESSLAVVGGVTVMSDPSLFVEFSRQGGLSPDGRCKAFSDAADGTGWGEGAGVLVLERLSDAERNGHPVLAVVRGSSVNQDGASNGLTAPNGPAQHRVIHQALESAGLSPSDVDVVEAHGTGTRLGDPIEVQALMAAYGQGRDHPLRLGSLKSNIGHTQAAAGVGGVIKMVMAMREDRLPGTLHAESPSSHVDWSASSVELLTEPVAWQRSDRPRRAGVSSFGVSGTNAHAVLEEAPQPEVSSESPPRAADGAVPWVLSARSRKALVGQAHKLSARIAADPALSSVDIGHSLANTRSLFEHRAVVVATGQRESFSALRALAGDEPSAAVIDGVADVTGRSVFLFPGQGTQWVGMGARLLAESAVFADRLAECADALSPFIDWSLLDVLRAADGAPSLDQVEVVQPASFAVMVSLAQMWRHHGVIPDAVVGHSQGEIAAAVVSGALSLADGARVVALRSQAIARGLAGAGGMMSIPLSRNEVEDRLHDLDGRVSVAALNGPRSVAVSGDPDALDELFDELTAADVRVRRIAVDYASHSAHVEALRDDLRSELAGIRPNEPEIPLFSTVTGEWVEAGSMDSEYWYRNLRQTVRFEPAIRTLVEQRYLSFVEVSAHPVLTPGVQEIVEESGENAVVSGTLRRDEGGVDRFVASLAALFVRGVDVDWSGLLHGGRRVDLPTYDFQPQRFWCLPSPREVEGASDSDESDFWNAVEQRDIPSLVSTLKVDEDSLATVLPALSSWRKERRQWSTVDDWRYRPSWKPLPNPPRTSLSGTWFVVTVDGIDDADVVAALTGSGAEVHRLVLDESCVDRAVLASRWEGCADPAGIVSVLAFDEEPSETHPALARGLALTVSLVQALGDAHVQAPLWSLTRNAVSTGISDELAHPVQAQVLGVGWTAALEHPQRWGGVVDLPADFDQRAAQRLCLVLAGRSVEDQWAIRSSGVLARRVVRAGAAGTSSRSWTPRGTVLVTGGTGAIAPDLARWLAGQGAERIVLTSRRGLAAPGAETLVAELAEVGTEATFESCDVTDRDAVALLLDRLKADGHTIRTVVHAAVVIELHTLDQTPMDSFAEVVHAKVAGARHLDELLDNDELDAFVLYSSIAGMWGSGAHAAYSAANAYLAALAENRRARGLPATSVHWGKWPDESGLDDADRHGIRRSGLRFLDPDLALAGLKRALDEDETVLALTDIDWENYHPVFTSARATTLFDEIPEVQRLVAGARKTVTAAADNDFVARLRGFPETEQHARLLELVRTEAAAVLGHGGGEGLPERRAFREVGFDSVTAVELRNRLARATGLTPPTTVVFDQPSPHALAGFLRSLIAGESASTEAVAATGGSDEPIAIVGIGCRLPGGANTPERLWRSLIEGADVISEFPVDRGWDAAGLYDPDSDRAGKTYSVRGGFLDDAAGFDSGFFGISPREAQAMDPQQRLLLETGWEAFERAGIDPASLRGSATGTFIGASHQGYGVDSMDVTDGLEGHFITGAASSVLSGRVSYLLGLEGPAVTVDTACSSSLVALHLACQSLRSGESDLALAGGATVMSTPQAFVGFSRLGALAADGRCKAFAESADGMSLAEGVGAVVLERLSDAQRNGHRVLAVVRGSATNQDGASNGMTAPNGPSQQRVIRQALANAGVDPAAVDAVEAHGTGTALGDPIEATALLATYGKDRGQGQPLWLGSLKSNIGHSQATAGIAGVIKMVLAMGHGQLPRTLHVDDPSSYVDWSDGGVALLTEPVAWPEAERPRRCGVSAFGISGTNAHVVLEQAAVDSAEQATPGRDGLVPWLLSGRSEQALQEQADRLRRHIDAGENPVDVGWSLATTRTSFEHRAVVLGHDREELERGLDAVASASTAPGVVRGEATSGTGTVFVFPGQGSQWWGMGRDLLATSPPFRESIEACERALAPFVDWSLTEVVSGEADPTVFDRVDVVQPALFAMMVSLADLWRSHGCEPAAVVGHSQGEIAAAYVAGALSLEDASRVVALRSKALLELSGQGGMVSVAAPVDRVTELMRSWDERISLAAINGPGSTVVSGETAALEELIGECERQGIRARKIAVDYASHCAQVEKVRSELARTLAPIRPKAATIPFHSTVAGQRLGTSALDAEYWYTNLRHTVRMEEATRSLLADGYRVFVEASPHPVLASAMEETLDVACPEPAVVLGSLRRDEGDTRRFLTSLAEAYAHGATVDWASVFPRANQVDLPTYPFQRSRYWLGEKRQQGASGELDAEFWRLVEDGDIDSLAAELGVGNGDRSSLGTVLPALAHWREKARRKSEVDAIRYRVSWTKLSETTQHSPGTRLVVAPAAGDQWVDRVLDALGPNVVRLDCASSDRQHLATRIVEAVGDLEITGVVSIVGAIEQASTVPGELTSTLALVQALGDAGLEAPLSCFTRGAVAVSSDERVERPVQGAVWGLGRVVALEHPDRWAGLVDLPEVVDDRVAERLRAALASDEDQVAVRSSGMFGRRLVHAAPARPHHPWQARGTALVTGGTGGVGAFVAKWVVERGAEHVVLTSRRGPNAPGAAELKAELEGLGARVTVAACDAGDREAVASVLAGITDGCPLRSVFHIAGVADGDDSVGSLTVEQLRALLRSKRDASLNLHELTRTLELDAFVLFSSGAAVWGSGGQPAYAAANAFLDALAEQRRYDGLPATSVAWGAWGESGMATDDAIGERLRRQGVLTMNPELALGAMERSIVDEAATATVTSMDWERFLPSFTATRPSPLLSELPEVREFRTAQEVPVATDDESSLRARLADLSGPERGRAVLDLVRAEASATLGHDAVDALPASRAFRDVGFDSVTAVELRNRLRAATGLALPAALVFDYPTPTALAQHLVGELFGGTGRPGQADDPDARIREVLTSIPLSRLRQAGLLEMVLQLAEDDGASETPDPGDAAGSIDDMDAESLLRLATGGTSN